MNIERNIREKVRNFTGVGLITLASLTPGCGWRITNEPERLAQASPTMTTEQQVSRAVANALATFPPKGADRLKVITVTPRPQPTVGRIQESTPTRVPTVVDAKPAATPRPQSPIAKVNEKATPAKIETVVDVKPAQSAEIVDPIKNVKINEEIPYTWFHPMSGEQVWSYGILLRDPNLDGSGTKSLSDQGNVGEIFLNGSSNVGLDIQTNDRYLADYRGDGARAAIWLTTGPGDVLVLMDKDNKPLFQVPAGDKGFAGLLLPDTSVQLGIRVVRKSGTQPIKAAFGNISKADYADPAKRDNPSVIDAANIVEATVPKPQATIAKDNKNTAPSDVKPAQSAEVADPIKNVKINEEISYTWFHPMSGEQVWSYGILLRDPNLDGSGTKSLSDQGNVGEIFLNGSSNVGLDIQTNDRYLADYRGDGARAAIWLTTGPGDILVLMDKNNIPLAQVSASDKGFTGLLLPDTSAQLDIRVVRKSGVQPVRVVFGNISKADYADPEKRGNPSVIDAAKFLVK